MAVPKRKTSKKVKRQRRTHKVLHAPSMAKCPNCNELRKPHYVCKSCGHYDGRDVVNQ